MEIIEEIEKINSLFNGIFVRYSEKDVFSDLENEIKRVAPFSHCAFLSFAKTHDLYGAQVLSSVKRIDCKLITLIMPENKENSLDFFSYAFNLPEEIRCVFTFDAALCDVCRYYADVKGIPFIFIPKSAEIGNFAENYIIFKNGEKLEKYSDDADKTIIINKNFMSDTANADSYAYVICQLLSLIDYRLCLSLDDEMNAKTYRAAKEAVVSAFSIFSVPADMRAVYLAVCCVKYQTADYMTKGKFALSTPQKCATYFYNGKIINDYGRFLSFSLKILRLYAACFSCKSEIRTMPNYLKRAEIVSNTLNIDETDTAECLLKEIRQIRSKLNKCIKTVNLLSKEVKGFVGNEKAIIGTYRALKGRVPNSDEKKTLAAIRHAGDLPIGFNGVSVLRETGMTDVAVFNADNVSVAD